MGSSSEIPISGLLSKMRAAMSPTLGFVRLHGRVAPIRRTTRATAGPDGINAARRRLRLNAFAGDCAVAADFSGGRECT